MGNAGNYGEHTQKPFSLPLLFSTFFPGFPPSPTLGGIFCLALSASYWLGLFEYLCTRVYVLLTSKSLTLKATRQRHGDFFLTYIWVERRRRKKEKEIITCASRRQI